ncbi:MAG: cytochrome c3 family protein [Magnetococcales bacterium]|nr:cytochrome c3 family protein [Magnetococcales bacterium]
MTKPSVTQTTNSWPHNALLSLVLLVGALHPLALQADDSAANVAEKNAWCLRCHGMETLRYQELATGKMRDLHVDAHKFSQSNHGQQGCVTCHKGDFAALPHRPENTDQYHSCADCHTGEKVLQRMRLVGITAQYKKSVHVQRGVPGFDCFSCHNPHESRLEEIKKPEGNIVDRDNDVCLKCHGTRESAEEKHRIIPKAPLHLKEVRCLECHTPRPGSVIHAIEPAARAERTCEACHSRDSILLTKLYKYRLHESERRTGFINGVVLSDYYVIGMTRHPLLDALGILGMGGAFVGVMVHGIGRWLAARRRQNHET